MSSLFIEETGKISSPTENTITVVIQLYFSARDWSHLNFAKDCILKPNQYNNNVPSYTNKTILHQETFNSELNQICCDMMKIESNNHYCV